VFCVQVRGRETGEQKQVGRHERSRSSRRAPPPPPQRVSCYFKHDDSDDAEPARQKKKGKRSCRRIRLAWNRNGCHFRT